MFSSRHFHMDIHNPTQMDTNYLPLFIHSSVKVLMSDLYLFIIPLFIFGYDQEFWPQKSKVLPMFQAKIIPYFL